MSDKVQEDVAPCTRRPNFIFANDGVSLDLAVNVGCAERDEPGNITSNRLPQAPSVHSSSIDAGTGRQCESCAVGRPKVARSCIALVALAAFATIIVQSPLAHADEGGVSFWLSGNFGSFAAIPADPGLSLSVLYLAGRLRASGDRPFTRGARITAGLDERDDLLYLSPTYTFAPRLAGGRTSLGLSGAFGRVGVAMNQTLTMPNGAAGSSGALDTSFGISDLYPTASLAWNTGSHNFMTYAMGGVPVGTYDPQRLATLGLNHWSIDGGGGYTYYDDRHEISAVLGFTYNFQNPATNYQSGVSAHLDWAASEVFERRFHVGLVGYGYQQLTGDTGSGATLGAFRSRVFGVGPQVGCASEVAGRTWYANVKSFYEFGAENRLAGWSLWLTLEVPIAGPRAHGEHVISGVEAR